MRNILILLFLLTAYNFILYEVSKYSGLPLFPSELWKLVILFSLDSVLFLSWLFGYKERTLVWISYVSLVQILGLGIALWDYRIVPELTPSFLVTLGIIWLFESPTERSYKRLLEERRLLEEKLFENSRQRLELLEKLNVYQELIQRLSEEKERIEKEIAQLDPIREDYQKLLKEKERLTQKINEAEDRLKEYRERIERLTESNKRLFESLETLYLSQKSEDTHSELSKLRKERKKLIKEILELQKLLEDVYKEKELYQQEVAELKKERANLKEQIDLLRLQLEEYTAKAENKVDIYREILTSVLENIEFEREVIRDFARLPADKKREFFKELLLLNMKDTKEPLESMKGYRNVFKLKPAGGRIYFTFGETKRWRVIGILEGEDDKEKELYAETFLLKYRKR
ncbi:coiled-coil domain-containing protein [Thermocrinis minervae]|uniref:CARD domain-containing protein n=1 Tax=Thermocrinis minervae TaxID=381751 RepID=A0A1M6SI48_9AQUI|nr:hypothetical protein [Thermocrinis minervae]SHK44365.1 hypothetical protein SAMN05444391_1036 [Thermocrinis minervae]